MVFSSSWFAIFAQVVHIAVAQPIGVYSMSRADRRAAAFDIYYYIRNNELDMFEFYSGEITPQYTKFTRKLREMDYPLYRFSRGRYAIDFSNTTDGVDKWYTGIQPDAHNITIHPGDLTTLTFTSYDSFYVMFGGRRLALIRDTYSLEWGYFLYTSTRFGVRMNFTVDDDDDFNTMEFSCGRRRVSPGKFDLVRNKESRGYESYDLSPAPALNEFRRRVRAACPVLRIKPGDLTYVVFSFYRKSIDFKSIFTVIGGRRFTLIDTSPK